MPGVTDGRGEAIATLTHAPATVDGLSDTACPAGLWHWALRTAHSATPTLARSRHAASCVGPMRRLRGGCSPRLHRGRAPARPSLAVYQGTRAARDVGDACGSRASVQARGPPRRPARVGWRRRPPALFPATLPRCVYAEVIDGSHLPSTNRKAVSSACDEAQTQLSWRRCRLFSSRYCSMRSCFPCSTTLYTIPPRRWQRDVRTRAPSTGAPRPICNCLHCVFLALHSCDVLHLINLSLLL